MQAIKVNQTFTPDPLDEPCGTEQDVKELLQVDKLQKRGMDGTGVKIAIVDTGINMNYLKRRGRFPKFDKELSWSQNQRDRLGDKPLKVPLCRHGTMAAYDACIAAPNCTLIDLPIFDDADCINDDKFPSDAIQYYARMVTWLTPADSAGSEAKLPSLVVNNSWVEDLDNDDSDGSLGQDSCSPEHPFNIVVDNLDAAGADILFIAGNSVSECENGQSSESSTGITGVNSSGAVLCIAGVAINKERLCYSTQGPGCLSHQKPDISSYTHFDGSKLVIVEGMKPVDGGTSAAAPVAAGVIAAVRSVYPSNVIKPAVLRNLIRRTAEDCGAMGFDYSYGYGIIDTTALLAALDKFSSL